MEDKLQVLKLVRKYARTNKTKSYNELLKYGRGDTLYNYFKGRMDMSKQVEDYIEQMIKEIEEAKNANPSVSEAGVEGL